MGLVVFVTSSCDDKTKEEVADVIVLSRSSVAFAEKGGTTTISVASPSEWTASCPDSWVRLHPGYDQLAITVDGNATDEIRNSKITVKSASDEHQVSVHQAYSKSAVHLSLTASDRIDFDSEGESSIFTVVTNGTWDATSDAAWLRVVRDEERSTVTISADKNEGATSRAATLKITSTLGSTQESCEVAVSQICHAENPYYNILGDYRLYATNWYYGGSALGVGGTGTSCTIEQNEYRKSVNIKNLFLDGTVVEAVFNKEDGTLTIELGKRCLLQELEGGTMRAIFLTKINMDTRAFYAGILTATPGKGVDDQGQIRDALLLGGFDNTYKSLGLTVFQSGTYASFSDLFYASGTMYLVRAGEPATNAVEQAASAVTPSGDGPSAFNN